MGYHIDTGLIKEKFKVDCECPLCEIQKVVEEQFLYEFLNDAVMEDNTRIKVRNEGFCAKHFDMLFSRQNKLSLALQVKTRTEFLLSNLKDISSVGKAKKQADYIEKSSETCAVCDYVEESMVKYYKTVAQLFAREKEFRVMLYNSKGFCLHHYAELLRYSSYAGITSKPYLELLSELQKDNVERIKKDLNTFCIKHDYRNITMPLGDAETALNRTRIKLYGKDLTKDK